jgi:lipopolysaccharide/colanic/teichoic acid biosynthesis glycosyltransferase
MQQTDNLAYSPDASLSSALLYAPILVNWPKTHILYTFFKRLMDVVLAVAALIILSPFFLITAAAIKLDSPGPVFFVHRRIGQKGKSINVYKFRSMVQGAQELTRMFTPDQSAQFLEHFKLENDFRVTKVGRFIRKTSIDELPQLVNILLGSLSFVGPRPVVEQELTKYGFSQSEFLSVKPGLTGYWQTSGRAPRAMKNVSRWSCITSKTAQSGWISKFCF